ncbi:hypothetical protein HMPREF9996_01375 [Aggregatibacter actinomycetemcomitans Y4]|nr:hypothetical protein ANH9381_0926 [Aggregatibacter actinomycetemcomitans ANH9381]AHN71525.1 hypothetical protein CF65_01089 [Aggregatibacter actinomycetemcomitans HK1651]EKX96031.1 hypothetical protein HMPREF9996_01375 [Aggregatibacter actinomycetemcomitans Y4]
MFKHKITLKIIHKRISSLIHPFGAVDRTDVQKNVVFANRTLM